MDSSAHGANNGYISAITHLIYIIHPRDISIKGGALNCWTFIAFKEIIDFEQ